MSIVAVFGGAYCSIEEIVEGIAEKLGYAIASEELSKAAAERSQMPESKVISAMAGSKSLFNFLTHGWEKNLVHVRAVLADKLGTERQLFHGPAAYLIPQPITHVLRVEIVADREYRIRQAMKQDGVDEREAASLIDQKDQELSKWTGEIVQRVSWDPFFCDMRIALPSRSVSEAVDAICESGAQDTFKPTAASRQAIRDLQLAASISTALLEKGRHCSEVRAEDGRVTVVVNRSNQPKGAIARTMHSLRYESVADEIRELCAGLEQVRSIEVRPGPGYKQRGSERKEIPAPPERADLQEKRAERKTRVLLVDDDDELRGYIAKRLTARGFGVHGAPTGESAVDSAEKQLFDVAVVDLKMPGIGGIETLRRLKGIQPLLQVLILTGCGTFDSAFESGQLDAMRFLAKPHDFDKLLADIEEAAHRKQSLQRSAYEREVDALDDHRLSSQELMAELQSLREKYEQ